MGRLHNNEGNRLKCHKSLRRIAELNSPNERLCVLYCKMCKAFIPFQMGVGRIELHAHPPLLMWERIYSPPPNHLATPPIFRTNQFALVQTTAQKILPSILLSLSRLGQ